MGLWPDASVDMLSIESDDLLFISGEGFRPTYPNPPENGFETAYLFNCPKPLLDYFERMANLADSLYSFEKD